MITLLDTLKLVAIEQPFAFKIIVNPILAKSKKIPMELPIFSVHITQARLPPTWDARENRIVENIPRKGWKLIRSNKYQSLLQMPESLGEGYVLCRTSEMQAACAEGPLEEQALVWVQSNAGLHMITQSCFESEDMKSYIVKDNALTIGRLNEAHVGRFAKLSTGQRLTYGLIVSQPRQDGTVGTELVCEHPRRMDLSDTVEIQENIPLSAKALAQFSAWNAQRGRGTMKAVSWRHAQADCELYTANAFKYITLMAQTALVFTRNAVEPLTLRASAMLPAACLLTADMVLPRTGAYFFQAQSANAGLIPARSLLAAHDIDPDTAQFTLWATFSPVKAGWKLVLTACVHTHLERAIKSYKFGTFEEAFQALERIVALNNLHVLMSQQGDDNLYTLAQSRTIGAYVLKGCLH